MSPDRPSDPGEVFSAPPLRRLSPPGAAAAPEDSGTPGREASGAGTAGGDERGDRAGSPDGRGSRSGAGPGSSDGDASGAGDDSERGASDPSDPLFSPLEPGPLGPVADAVPSSMQWLITALAALAALALGAALLATRRSGSAARRRRALLGDLGLQSALLPPVPARVGGLGTSVAYRPWDGAGAGGAFYDVFPLANGRAGAVIGEVAGHGRGVIGRTLGLTRALRAYLEAGLEPRTALELAGRVLERDRLAPLATVLLAAHDPETEVLTWASAGHPPPILLGAEADEPLTAAAAPPLGAGIATGLRQTTVPFPPGSTACLFTKGLSEVRTREGRRLGRARLAELADGLGDRLSLSELVDRVGRDALEIADDLAVCVLRAAEGGDEAGGRDRRRVEELALPPGEVSTSTMQRFLWACGIEPGEALATIASARELARSHGRGVLLRVETDRPSPVEILPLESASLAATT